MKKKIVWNDFPEHLINELCDQNVKCERATQNVKFQDFWEYHAEVLGHCINLIVVFDNSNYKFSVAILPVFVEDGI